MTFRKKTTLTKEQIKKVLPELVSYKKLTHENSVSNLLYELKDNKREYILRCTNPYWHRKTENEVAVINHLKGKIPVPKIYKYSLDKDEIGLEYILMEKVKGIPLSDTWKGLNDKDRLKIVKQLAKSFSLMKQSSFKKIGSFDIDMNVIEFLETKAGPYTTFKEYITDKTLRYVKHIKDHKEYIPKIKKYFETIKNYKIPLVLTHTDICPKNIMVDDNKITAFLDFEWCTNAPYVEDILNCPSDFELNLYPKCEKAFFDILKKNGISTEVKPEIKEIYTVSGIAMCLAYYKDWYHGKPKQAEKYALTIMKELDVIFKDNKI